MAVHWDCAECAAYDSARAAAEAGGEFDHTVKEWDEFCDLREALIWALLVTGFPSKSGWAITKSNWKEVFIRLSTYERAQGCMRVYSPAEGETKPRKVWFTPEEVHSMIGLSVNAGNKTDTEFRNHLYRMLSEDAVMQLNRWESDNE